MSWVFTRQDVGSAIGFSRDGASARADSTVGPKGVRELNPVEHGYLVVSEFHYMGGGGVSVCQWKKRPKVTKVMYGGVIFIFSVPPDLCRVCAVTLTTSTNKPGG